MQGDCTRMVIGAAVQNGTKWCLGFIYCDLYSLTYKNNLTWYETNKEKKSSSLAVSAEIIKLGLPFKHQW